MCPDEWMQKLGVNLWDGTIRAGVEAIQWELSQDLLARGATVIIEWGTWARAEREVLRERARELGARAELWYLAVDIEELWRRVGSRQMEDPPIGRQDLEAWFSQIQVPTDEEVALFDPH
jgi:predicted kinase